MRVDLGELVRSSVHPFVRHTVGAATYDAAWAHRDAVLLHGARHTVVLGPPDEVTELLDGPAGELSPVRLIVAEASYAATAQRWPWVPDGHWQWRRTSTPAAIAGSPCEEVTDDAAIDAVLDVAHPSSFARPGTPGIETWLGVRLEGRLVGVGAIRRDPDGSGHLRGVSVLPEAAGRGLGGVLSAALTRRAMDRPPHVATLGVYLDNTPALRIYDRLGFVVEHTFVSGPVPPQSRRWSTTAVAPSR